MSTHKLMATLPHGDPDLGAEIECQITFSYTRGRPAVMYLRNGDPGYPADPAEIELVSATPTQDGKYYSAGAENLEWLHDFARDWLESDDGQNAAFEAVADDDERAREYAAEARAEMRREDR
jgi:hypothetical protein